MPSYTPTFHYNLSGSLSYDDQKDNYKGLTYILMNHPQTQYRWSSVDSIIALIGWIHVLSLGNPGHVNTIYSNNGKGFLAWPESPLNSMAADLGLPWYDGQLQSSFLNHYCSSIWSGSTFWSYQTFISDVTQSTYSKANQLYYYCLRQYLVGVPEASYGGDLSDAMANTIVYYGERWSYWVNRWINEDWSDNDMRWLLFMFQRKKERGELFL